MTAAAADAIVVGAGMAGLRCAVELRALWVEPLVLEAGAGGGGSGRRTTACAAGPG